MSHSAAIPSDETLSQASALYNRALQFAGVFVLAGIGIGTVSVVLLGASGNTLFKTVVFTVFPAVLLAAAIGLSYYEILYNLQSPKLLVVPVVLVFMLQHQFIEFITFVQTGTIGQGLLGETFETCANTFAGLGVYYVLAIARTKDDLADQLEASERKYRRLIEYSPLPIVVCTDGTVVFANDAAADILGASDPSAIEEEPLDEFVHPDHRETFTEHISAMQQNKSEIRTAEHTLCGLDDEDRTVEVSGGYTTYEDEDSAFLVLRDVTKEREYEAGMKRAESQLETTLESSNDAIFLIDPDEQVLLDANTTSADLLGYDRDEMVGMAVEEIHPHEMEAFQEFASEVIDGGNFVTDDLSCLSCHGEQIPVEISAARVETDDGDAILAAARDISERRRREQQLEVLRRILRHNLRNDMSIVIGSAELIANEADDELLVDAAERIQSNSQGLIDTSENVRKLEELIERTGENREQIDLVGVLETTVDACRSSYPSATIETDFPDTAPVLGTEALGWAVEHLIENAIEHNPDDDPWVRVRLERREDEMGRDLVTVFVEDDGPGIPETELSVVEEGIEQTSTFHGSGFGLHTVNQIVDVTGGELNIGSHPETEGACVQLSLPATA